MTLQRFLILLFVAVLTAGTAAATSVTLMMAADDFGVVNVDGKLAISYEGSGLSGYRVTFATLDLSDGWHDMSIDYKNMTGSNSFTLFDGDLNDPHWVTATDLRCLDADGKTINGLRGDYFTLDGTFIKTIYGEGPLSYVAGQGPWAGFGPNSLFEEKLSGQFYVGPEPAPLGTISPPTLPADPPPPTQSEVPEPAGWVFMVAALPVMFLSRGLRRVAARQESRCSTH